jgi:SNF2 family DNA or RNA helicase
MTVMTAIPQSMSPDGLEFGPRRKSFEKFFIDSVRHFAGEIEDPKLLAEISAFQAQEATHRRQHQRYNELLCELRGYELDRIERPERERIDWAYRELTARRRLAGTTASEHLTAILADEMLTRKEPMAGADPAIRRDNQRKTPRPVPQYFLFPEGYDAQSLHHARRSWKTVEHS